ncbi:MAG: TonB-dependent receptor [Acidobacteria bacterium]|nr:TonB-dependent receptor [Acidobacteriota bacterium]
MPTRRIALFAVVLAASAALALAQTGTSRIIGTVTDTSGAVVPNATVTVVNEATGVRQQQTTTEAGVFGFPSLPVGSYTITVEMPGFKTARSEKNILEVGTPLTINLTLEVGTPTETITVEAAAERLQTANAALGHVVEQKVVVDLPLNGRNPLALLVLEPGVVQRSSGAAGSGIHVNGSRDRAFNVTVDGIEANESTVPNPMSNMLRINPDNVQEYKVTTSNATAEEGRNSGASVSVATRTGTNEFHGTAFNFLRNTALNSNEFFANALGTPKPDIKMNQYGFEVGGPVKRNQTFFFASWQGQKVNIAQPIDQSYGQPGLYTPTARSGIYRYFRADPRNPFVLDGQRITRNTPLLVDPSTGALRSGVRACGSDTDLNCLASFNMFANDPRRIGADPAIAKLLQTLPNPNAYTSGDGLNTATYLWNTPYKFRGPHYMARVDHAFDANNTFFARYLHSDHNTLDGDPLNSRPRMYPGFPPMGEVFRHSKNLAVSYRRVFSPRVVNELTAGFSRFIFLFTQGEANPAFPDVPPYARASGTAFNNLDMPYINTPRTFRAVTTPQILDNLSVITGSHVLRMGFNFRFYQHNDQRGQPGGVNVTPVLSFSYTVRPPAGFNLPGVATSSVAGIDPTDSNRLQGTINDVLGIPSRLSQVFLGDLQSDTFLPFRAGNSVTLWNQGHRLKQYNFYFQDEWKARRNLTVNAGARWEANPAPTEAAGRVYVPNKSITGGEGPVTFVKSKRWFQRNNVGAIGPRLGITYSPRRSTVIRTGYGIAFDTVSSFQVTAVSGRVPGLTTSCASTVGGSTTPGCMVVPDKRVGEGFPSELTPPTTKPSSYLTPSLQTLTNAPGLTVFDQKLKIPTVHQWNFNIQQELPGGMVAQVGYVARRGTRLFRAYDVNQINADAILPSFFIMQQNLGRGCNPDGSGCPSGVTGAAVPIVTQDIVAASFVNSSTSRSDLALNGAGNMAGRIEQTTLAARLRPNQQFATITYIDSGGNSYYHSGQATLRKRFQNGLLVGVAYTFAKSIDDQSVDPVAATSGGGLSTTNSRTPTDTRNWRGERGRSDFDRRHVLTSNWIYELPVGKGKRFGASLPSVAHHVLGGWSLNGIYTYMSGEPFSVRSGVRTSNYSHESRADLKPGVAAPKVQLQEIGGVIGPVVFPNADAFAYPAPGTNGIGRNTFEAPGYWNMDLGIHKRFDLTERVKLQLRTEMFNALNHANFDNPRDASVGSPSMRSTVFAQTCCATVAPPSTQTIIQTGESGRVIQFALKLQF